MPCNNCSLYLHQHDPYKSLLRVHMGVFMCIYVCVWGGGGIFKKPPYDVRRAQELLGESCSAIERCRSEVVPRKKFTFSSHRQICVKRGGAKADDSDHVSVESVVPLTTETEVRGDGESSDDGRSFSIVDRVGDVIYIDGDITASSNYRDLRITNLSDCVVIITETLGALRAFSLTRCVLLVGSVSGSLHLEKCTDCAFVFAARQVCRRFHMHSSWCGFAEWPSPSKSFMTVILHCCCMPPRNAGSNSHQRAL